jgi:hypothetical protein
VRWRDWGEGRVCGFGASGRFRLGVGLLRDRCRMWKFGFGSAGCCLWRGRGRWRGLEGRMVCGWGQPVGESLWVSGVASLREIGSGVGMGRMMMAFRG